MALQDFYNTGANTFHAAYGANVFTGQTFTAGATYSIVKVSLLLYRTGTPDTVTVELQSTSSGLPTNTILASGTTDGNTLTTSSSGEWREITFSVPYNITSGTVYAIVIKALTGTGTSDAVNWRADNTPGLAGGIYVFSNNGGSTWANFAHDMLFETYSADPIDHEVSGVCAVSFGTTSILTGTFLITGALQAALSLASALSSDIFVAGAMPITMGLSSPRLFKLFKVDHTVPIRRLIAAGNNRIYMEDI